MAAGCSRPGKTAPSVNSLRSGTASDERKKFCFSSFFVEAFQIALLPTLRPTDSWQRPGGGGVGGVGGAATPIRQPDPRGKHSERRTPIEGGLENPRRRAGSRGGETPLGLPPPPPPPPRRHTFCLGDSVSCHRTLESRFHCDSSRPRPPPARPPCLVLTPGLSPSKSPANNLWCRLARCPHPFIPERRYICR